MSLTAPQKETRDLARRALDTDRTSDWTPGNRIVALRAVITGLLQLLDEIEGDPE